MYTKGTAAFTLKIKHSLGVVALRLAVSHEEYLLLDHVVNLLVCHQGHVGATLVGLLLTVDDSPLHY